MGIALVCENGWVPKYKQPILFILFAIATRANGQETPSLRSYSPITGRQRVAWFANSTLGARSLAGGLFAAGFGTGRDAPHVYGPHWEGFGKRYGMRLTGVSTGNAMEASIGRLWGEDPRYFRVPDAKFKGRVRNVLLTAFTAPREDGHFSPAYARYMSTAGNNFLSNTWRPDSEATTKNAITRTLWGFVGRMGSNAFLEFWPDVKSHVFRSKR
jgi:hypothetical protein